MTNLRGARLAALLFALGMVTAGGAYMVNEYAVDALLKDTAKQTSQETAIYFAERLPGVEGILDGIPPSAESIAFLRGTVEAKGVHVLKLYNLAGKLVLDTEQLEPGQSGEEQLGSHNPDAFAALSANDSFVKLEEETEDGHKKLLSETYVPIARQGKTIGVAETYIDQTEKAAQFRRSFIKSSAFIALLVALGFFVPAYGYLLRTRQKLAADESLHFLANHDALTALPNRARFAADLAARLAKHAGETSLTAVHFVDLDLFKEINDRHGREFGDDVLRSIALRLRGNLREADIVSRFGADQFVIAQVGLPDHVQLAAVTKRIMDAFREPVRIRNTDVTVTASVGTAVGLTANGHAEKLIEEADTAVYVVKSRGRNGHCFFEPRFDAEKRRRMQLESLVRNAVTEKKFELYFQPLFSFNNTRLKGFEALLRLRDDKGNHVSPAEFIPLAEDIGLIDEIGHWVLEQACTTASSWPQELQISVNLSVAQFKRHSIVQSTRAALLRSGLAARRLLLEITESLLLTDTEGVIAQLQDLKKLGAAIVMDDFGTGYSSLGYMLKFPFDRIKIDRSFISALGDSNESATTVVETIIALGHTLKMNVTAEGVETPLQAGALRAMKCDDAQGYLFGRPMPASDIPALLKSAAMQEDAEAAEVAA